MRTSPRRRTPFPDLILVGWFFLALPVASHLPAHAQGQPDIFNVEVAADDPGAGDLFACALSLSREGTLVVGSVLDDGDDDLDLATDSGSIYVFRRQGGGFTQTAKLRAMDGASEHRLGFSVSVDRDGNRFAAGAIFHDGAGENAGAAYVFRREGGGWVEEARLIPDALGPFDQLGHSIALSGDVLAVGAPGDDTRGDAAGTVYVFERGANGWTLAAMLTAGQGENVGDGLGFSVALDGDTLLAGAPFADDGLGAVHVFMPTIEGWQEVQRLTAPQRRTGALFGAAVALDGDQAAVGARLDDGAGDRAGAVWTFRRIGGVWGVEQQLPAPGLAAGDELGISVALDGDALAVGARFADVGAPDTGAVYRYRRRGGQWRFEQRLKAAVPAAGDELGFAVAVEDMELQADDLVVAGAYRADSEAGPDSGLARLRVEGIPADLEITKSDGRAVARTDDELVYRIRVRNLGPADVGEAEGGAQVTDVFGTGLADCTWTCMAEGNGADCRESGSGPIDETVSLPATTSVLFEATCTVVAPADTTITNRARVEPPEDVEDPDLENNEAVDVTRIQRDLSDLEIDKSADPDPVTAGQPVTYTITVRNVGTGDATGTRVTDDFLDFVDLPSDIPPCTWTCEPTGTGASCGQTSGAGALDDGPTLPADTSVTYTAECTVPETAEGFVTNTATATGPDNVRSITVTTPVLPRPGESDVSVTVLPNPEDAPDIEGRVVVASLGTAPTGAAFIVTLTLDPAVAGFTVTGAPCPPDSPSSATCTIGPLAPGEEILLDIDIPADCDNLPEVDLTAEAVIDDINDDNDRDSDTLALTPPDACPVNLRVLKGAASAVVGSLSPAFFTIQVSNSGPETAFGARVNDPIPPGLFGATWTCTASPGATCTPEQGSGGIVGEVDLPPGGTVTYSLRATVDTQACGTVTNTAFVTAVPPNVDTQPGDNSSSVSFFAVPANGTCAVKTVFPKAQLEGGEITYTILLVHGGPGTLGGPGPEFEDIVPSELTVVGVGADRGIATFVGNIVRWDGTLQPGESVTITITATVDSETLGMEICNQGLVIPGIVPTDDPGEPGFEDPTCLFVVAFIPTLSPVWMSLLAILLAALGLIGVRRRRSDGGARSGSTPSSS